MLTRSLVVTVALVLTMAGCGGSGGNGPTAPSAVPSVAGNYSGTGSVSVFGGFPCNTSPFGFVNMNLDGEIRQAGTTLDMDLNIVVPDDTSFAPILCSFNGSLTGTAYSATLRGCSASSGGTDPTQGIVCADGTTRNAMSASGVWTGSIDSGRLTGTVEVTFSTVNPANNARETSLIVRRDLELGLVSG